MWSPHRMSSFCCGRAGMLWDYLQVTGPAGLWALGCRPCPEFTVWHAIESIEWRRHAPEPQSSLRLEPGTAAFLMAAFMGRCLPMSVRRFQRQLWVRCLWGCGQSLGICLYRCLWASPRKGRNWGARETAQQLGVLIALAEELGLVLSTHYLQV